MENDIIVTVTELSREDEIGSLKDKIWTTEAAIQEYPEEADRLKKSLNALILELGLMENNDIVLHKSLVDSDTAQKWYDELLTSIEWHKSLKMTRRDEMATIPRKMAYIADAPIMYRYDKYELPGSVWNDTLLSIKAVVEENTGEKFNSVLLNLYEDGKDEIGWHFDKEKQLGPEPLIVCLNLGAGRKFSFKNKVDKTLIKEYWVQAGDLLVMGRECQKNWFHAILKDLSITQPRISLTFRWVYPVSNISLANIMDKPTPYYDIYIGRENRHLNLEGSKWGNPFRMKNESEREGVLARYEEHIESSPELLAALPELEGKVLGCYCVPKKCHGGVLIKLYERHILKLPV